MNLFIEQFDTILSSAHAWFAKEELLHLSQGVQLSEHQLSAASHLGICHPGSIRLVKTPSISIPDDPVLRCALAGSEVISCSTCAIAFRYGVSIRSDQWDNDTCLYTQLAHVAQYENHGSIEAYLSCYLRECFKFGVAHAPMEKEAVLRASSVFKMLHKKHEH